MRDFVKKSQSVFILSTIILLGIYWLKSFISLDPDFGWRLRAGIMYLSSGIPLADPFTYTMSSFFWVDHAWLASALIGWWYPLAGKAGLSFIFCLIALLAIFIALSRGRFVKKKLGYFGSISFLLSVAIILPFSGVRAQVFTWFLLALFLKVLLDKKLWMDLRKFVPLYFVLWANIHGGFASGLVSFFVVLVAKTSRKKKLDFLDVGVFLFSVLATLINPYGIGVWREVWSSVSDTSLRWSIAEWRPLVFSADLSMAFFLTLSLTLVFKYRKRFKLEELGLYCMFLLQAISSLRHLPLWVLVSLPMTASAISAFYQEIKKDKISVVRFDKVYKFALVLTFVVVVVQMTLSLWNSFYLTENMFYPKKAVVYLKNRLPEGKIFSNYGWGGYLIWKLPEKKVFVDGRMPSWRRKSAPQNEEIAVFDLYKEVLKGEADYKGVFDKYDIDTVLWPKPKKPGLLDIFQDKIENVLIKFGREKESFDFLKALSKDGWTKEYEDTISVIYKKPL